MATTINEATQVTLLDGTSFEVKPLKISLLRDFMKTFDQIAKVADDNDKSMDLLIQCVQVALKQYKPDLAADAKALEELLNLPLVYSIVEAASGIQLGETNFLNADI
jgi:hypothetical protein